MEKHLMRTEEFTIKLEQNTQQATGNLLLEIDETGVSGDITLGTRKSFFRGKTLRKDHYVISVSLPINGKLEDCDGLFLVREDGSLLGLLLSLEQTWTLTGKWVG